MADDLDITQLLLTAGGGAPEATERLFAALYDDLRRVARERMRREDPAHTLQATALVHEAFVRLIDQTRCQWKNRAHFLAVASRVMRRILVDHARARGRIKRGGDFERVPFDEQALAAGGAIDEGTLLALDDALRRLEPEHPEAARVVEMRFFGGLTQEESASVLGVTDRTIRRHWDFARAWLFRELSRPQAG